MTDRELLELAAKAAGCLVEDMDLVGTYWNPLIDDGDALRLAVKLELSLHRKHGAIGISCPHFDGYAWQSFDNEADDRVIAKETRCAITYAAAIIGANDGL